MSSGPRSPSLDPPPKGIELEGSGTHNLESSSEDEFSDAREAIASPTRPITRVDRVDVQLASVEVPSTASYGKRAEGARPDMIAVQSASQTGSQALMGIGGKDAGETNSAPVPKTVVTRADSMPAHVEVLETKAVSHNPADPKPENFVKRMDNEPSNVSNRSLRADSPYRDKSPIAADGGFGPMEPESPADEPFKSTTSGSAVGIHLSKEPMGSQGFDLEEEKEEQEKGEVSGDDFDEFTEGEHGDDFEDDFGDFDDFQEDDTQPSGTRAENSLSLELSYVSKFGTAAAGTMLIGINKPIPDFSSGLPAISELEESLAKQLDVLFPAMEQARNTEAPDLPPEANTAFLSDRSYSLWQQLIAPPPLQPPNWVRSRVRRLFLVSLGVPVDLDEILPKSKQKKLVLHYDPTEQLNKPALKGKDSKPSNSTSEVPKRTRGPPPPPEFDIEEVEGLCKKTEADLEEMSDEDLKVHVMKLETLAEVGKTVLQYWVKRKEMAVDEKEAFDSVVESLVRHARRVRK